MRYPTEQIKAAIQHPDIEIRYRAVSYFAKAFSPDPTVMPLVIKAVESFGRENEAYRLIAVSKDLVQTEDTIAWVIDELNDEQTERYENYAFNLSTILVQADPALLLPRETDILNAGHFEDGLREPLATRLQMLAWDDETCWRRLEEFCEESKGKQFINEVNLGHAHLVVEALARHASAWEPTIRDRLAIQVEDYRDHPMTWMEPLLVRLAGLARMESTIPLIVAKLQNDGGDLLNEECSAALTRIGTPTVLHAIAEAFPTSEDHFRVFALSPLEYIQSDLAVEIGIKLFEQEENHNLRCELVQGLLGQFAFEAIELARKLLCGRVLNFNDKGLRRRLLETCTLTGDRFPEYDKWIAIEKAEREEHWRRVKELEDDPIGLFHFALEKLSGVKLTESSKPNKVLPPTPGVALRRSATKQKVGRNDPCPCGSGKKFKICCMKR